MPTLTLKVSTGTRPTGFFFFAEYSNRFFACCHGFNPSLEATEMVPPTIDTDLRFPLFSFLVPAISSFGITEAVQHTRFGIVIEFPPQFFVGDDRCPGRMKESLERRALSRLTRDLRLGRNRVFTCQPWGSGSAFGGFGGMAFWIAYGGESP